MDNFKPCYALKKLAFLCNNMKSTNGVERVLSQRLSLLAGSGMYEVYLITYNQYGAPFSFPISDKVHYIDLATRYIERCSYHGLFQYLDRLISKITYKKALCRCLSIINPDVISCVDIHLADLTTVLDYPTNATKVVECHCGLSAYYADLETIRNPYKKNKERKIKEMIIHTISRFDRIVVLTEDEKSEWDLGDKVVSIPNMLISYPENLPDRTTLHHRVISVGRYAYQKGYDLLIDVWKLINKRHPDWSLHIYGSHDGDMGDCNQLKRMIVDSQMQNVFLHEATNEVYAKYDESDFYVMSSRYESFGLVLIEAMSCGLPIVSFDCKYGPRSIIVDGETGILAPPSDVKKLAESISYMIEHTDERMSMGRNAYTSVAKYKPERIMSIWQQFYQSL